MIVPIAHGVGSRGDLPLPLWQFAWAAMAAIIISFLALGILWNRPRLAGLSHGVRLGSRLTTLAGHLTRFGGAALYLLVLATALFGVDDSDVTLAPVAVYVVVWVGIATLSGALWDAWDAVNPFRFFASIIDRRRTSNASAGERSIPVWSTWWAPLGLLGFLTLELVHPAGDSPRLMGWAMLVHLAVTLGGIVAFGARWLRHGEPFSMIFRSLGAMAPIGSSDDDSSGTVRLRTPLSGLSRLHVLTSGLVGLLVVLGGTSFDGFVESAIGRDLFDVDGRWTHAVVLFAGLLGSIAVVSALYLVATRFAANSTGTPWSQTLIDFAPSLVPIVFGYTVAHYAQLLVDETQTFVFLLSDPFGRGWNLFGGADNRINFNLISVDLIAWIQAGSIVVGHIAAVIVAHDRAVERFTERDASRSQYAMVFAMVLYSLGGLWLLLNA